MSRTFKYHQPKNILHREVVLQLRNFRPRVITGAHLTHFSTIPSKGKTNHALLVYQAKP